MIESRRELLCRMPLGCADSEVHPDDLPRIIKVALQEAESDIPVMKNLRSATVETVVGARKNQLWLAIFLNETAQLPLLLTPGKGITDGIYSDPYLQDLSQAIQQRDAAPLQIEIALSISPAPHSRVANTGANCSINDVRASIKRRLRRSETVHVAGLPESLPLHLEKPPQILPEGTLLTISAVINSLTRNRAQLTRGYLEDVGQVPEGCVFEIPDKIYMLRIGDHKSPQSGTILQTAMDLRQPLKMKVLLTYDWVDGTPSHLELVDFVG